MQYKHNLTIATLLFAVIAYVVCDDSAVATKVKEVAKNNYNNKGSIESIALVLADKVMFDALVAAGKSADADVKKHRDDTVAKLKTMFDSKTFVKFKKDKKIPDGDDATKAKKAVEDAVDKVLKKVDPLDVEQLVLEICAFFGVWKDNKTKLGGDDAVDEVFAQELVKLMKTVDGAKAGKDATIKTGFDKINEKLKDVSDDPNDGGFPWMWVLIIGGIILIIIIVVVVVVVMKRK